MKTRLSPRLVNGATGDPALLVEIEGAGRSVLFDCGDLSPLSPADLLRVSDLFVSHAHIDHFFGFDRLLRVNIGTVRTIRVHGPPGMASRVRGKLAGYHWNLYGEDGLEFVVTEVAPGGFRTSTFHVRDRFRPIDRPVEEPARPLLLDDDDLAVGWETLDHGIPCLAYRLAEPGFLNVDPDRLAASGLAAGPWLADLKEAARAGAPPSTPIETPGGRRTLDQLADLVVRRPGRRIAYVADTAWTPAVEEAVVRLAGGVDVLYCEHYYLEEDRALAERNRHLTARQAGLLARAAGVGELVAFHHAPKYADRIDELIAEGRAAFEGPE